MNQRRRRRYEALTTMDVFRSAEPPRTGSRSQRRLRWGRQGGSTVFSRVAIANRGEAAMRLIHAVRDLSAETGTRIETIALYTDLDRTATFVREADLASPLGPAAARPYLNHDLLGRALRATEADAA